MMKMMKLRTTAIGDESDEDDGDDDDADDDKDSNKTKYQEWIFEASLASH